MRFFALKKLNWKYIFGEILLLFIGINLAIWFNDWNESKSILKNKEIALAKIKGEITANLEELVQNGSLNQRIPAFFKEIDSLEDEEGRLILSPKVLQDFTKRYSDYFVQMDSVKVDDGHYQYEGETFLRLEISDLSSIAWDISKSTGIFHEFGYDCLYQIQAMYNTQELVEREFEKATEALRNQSIDDLVRILGILHQLENQLERQYRNMIVNIENCE